MNSKTCLTYFYFKKQIVIKKSLMNKYWIFYESLKHPLSWVWKKRHNSHYLKNYTKIFWSSALIAESRIVFRKSHCSSLFRSQKKIVRNLLKRCFKTGLLNYKPNQIFYPIRLKKFTYENISLISGLLPVHLLYQLYIIIKNEKLATKYY